MKPMINDRKFCPYAVGNTKKKRTESNCNFTTIKFTTTDARNSVILVFSKCI